MKKWDDNKLLRTTVISLMFVGLLVLGVQLITKINRQGGETAAADVNDEGVPYLIDGEDLEITANPDMGLAWGASISSPVLVFDSGPSEITMYFTDDGLVIEGDPNGMNEAAEVFLNEYIKPMADEYVKERTK